MGGFTRPIAEGISDAVGKAYDKLEGNSVGKSGIDFLWSMSRSFKQHPTGESVYKMAEEGIRVKHEYTQNLMKPLNDFKGEVRKNSALAIAHDYKTAPLQQIHASLPPGHSARSALDPLMARPEFHTSTLDEIGAALHAEGNMVGRQAAFGPQGMNLAATIYPMLTGHDPVEQTKANAWLGILSQVFKDTGTIPNVSGPRSGIKSDVATSINRMRKGVDLDPIKMDVSAEYVPATALERKMHKYGMTYLAPFITMAHLADFYKLGTLPATSVFKALTTLGDKDLQDLKTASGIFFHTMNSIYQNDFEYRTGALARRSGLPDAAAILHKTYHNPLFNNERMLQLSIMGSAAYHSAQMWGKQALHGNARAIEELKEMHLNVNKIVDQGGELTEDELKQAIWHFTNNRLFIDKPMDRSRLAQKGPFMRVSSMFHGYITKEGSWLSRELMKLGRTNDYVGLAQFAGTVGIAFPMSAPLLLGLQTLVRTASPEKAKKEVDEDYGSMFEPKGMEDFSLNYLKLLAHFGAAGAFMQYVHAADNYKLAANLAGPVPGVAIGTAEDIVHGVKGTKSGEHNWRPTQRDFLRYMTLPIFGNWVAEHEIPKGRQSGGSLKFPSHRRRGRR